MNTIIFTEIVNCGPVGSIMLESFHKYHDMEIIIYATQKDIEDLGEIKNHPNNRFWPLHSAQYDKFKHGHAGTAVLFAEQFYPGIDKNIIHLDSDLVFKKESISLIENAFEEGYDIVGSRRCYKNNPGKVPVPDGIPDAVSTYFFGMKTKVLPKGYSFEEMCKMWEGHPIGIDHMILDFGDSVYFNSLKNGAKTKFLDSNLIGGQNELGSKVNNYKSNLHLDMGSHLLHMGGCGSGCAVHHGHSNPEKSYADWAVGRFDLFAYLFLFRNYFVDGKWAIKCNSDTVINEDGRWVNGIANEEIFNQVFNDLFDIKTIKSEKSLYKSFKER